MYRHVMTLLGHTVKKSIGLPPDFISFEIVVPIPYRICNTVIPIPKYQIAQLPVSSLYDHSLYTTEMNICIICPSEE